MLVVSFDGQDFSNILQSELNNIYDVITVCDLGMYGSCISGFYSFYIEINIPR